MAASWVFSSFAFFIIFSIYFFDEVTSGPRPIVGGKLAGKGEFGYHVSVEMFNVSICGGAILDDYYVITAAHCIINEDNEFEGYPLKVVVGAEELDTDCEHKVTAEVDEIFIPAEYDIRQNKYKNRTIGDIAVLKLKTGLGIKKHKYLKKLDLPPKDKNYDDKIVIVTGFGYNQYDRSKKYTADGCLSRNNKLHYTEAVVMNICKCRMLRKKPINDHKHLCASAVQVDQNNPVGICSGDSGGPLVYKKKRLIGIVSSGPTRCREDKAPAVYTKVWPFLSFIKNARKGRIDEGIRNMTLLSWNEWQAASKDLIIL